MERCVRQALALWQPARASRAKTRLVAYKPCAIPIPMLLVDRARVKAPWLHGQTPRREAARRAASVAYLQTNKLTLRKRLLPRFQDAKKTHQEGFMLHKSYITVPIQETLLK